MDLAGSCGDFSCGGIEKGVEGALHAEDRLVQAHLVRVRVCDGHDRESMQRGDELLLQAQNQSVIGLGGQALAQVFSHVLQGLPRGLIA